MPRRYKHLTPFFIDGERFAVKMTDAGNVNFWHITEEHTRLYTFVAVPGYDDKSCWEERKCKNVLADLTSETPSFEVLRYAVDGRHVFPFGDEVLWPIPKTPPLPVLNPQQQAELIRHVANEEKKRSRNI